MDNRSLVLGSAMWGWGVDKKNSFELLDYYYSKGFREIDTATNYPINRNKSFFRFAENVLGEWIKANGIKDLKIIVKVGSLSNDGSSVNNLTKSFLLLSRDYYLEKFSSNLGALMIHWDQRDSEEEIRESLEAWKIVAGHNIGIGISGIKYPAIYAKVADSLGLNFIIEFKHNLLFSGVEQYSLFGKSNRFLAYGINMGGIKLSRQEYREESSAVARGIDLTLIDNLKEKLQQVLDSLRGRAPLSVKTLNHLNFIYAYNTPGLSGIIIGPSGLEQLRDTISFFEQLKTIDTFYLYDQLKNIIRNLKK